MDRPIAFPYSKKCLGLGKTFLNARTILSTAPESHRSWRWMMAISPQVNSHQQQFGSGSISFGTERVTGSNSRGFKKLGVGSAWLPAPLAGAAVPQLSSFPSRSSGSGCDSHGLSQTSLRNLPNSLQRPAGLPAGDACKLHREEMGGASNCCETTLGNFGNIDAGVFPRFVAESNCWKYLVGT